MNTQSSDFMESIRRRIKDQEHDLAERRKAISEQAQNDEEVPKRAAPTWIKAKRSQRRHIEKSSILNLIHGTVSTAASTKRHIEQTG